MVWTTSSAVTAAVNRVFGRMDPVGEKRAGVVLTFPESRQEVASRMREFSPPGVCRVGCCERGGGRSGTEWCGDF